MSSTTTALCQADQNLRRSCWHGKHMFAELLHSYVLWQWINHNIQESSVHPNCLATTSTRKTAHILRGSYMKWCQIHSKNYLKHKMHLHPSFWHGLSNCMAVWWKCCNISSERYWPILSFSSGSHTWNRCLDSRVELAFHFFWGEVIKYLLKLLNH